MRCDWYGTGGCSEPPYGVIGLTDGTYWVYCSQHAVEALEESCEYIGTHSGVVYDDEIEEMTGGYIMAGGKQDISKQIINTINNTTE